MKYNIHVYVLLIFFNAVKQLAEKRKKYEGNLKEAVSISNYIGQNENCMSNLLINLYLKMIIYYTCIDLIFKEAKIKESLNLF